jgi:mono/diheme cytochrome c family protein
MTKRSDHPGSIAIAVLFVAMSSALAFAAAQKPSVPEPKPSTTVNNPAEIASGKKIFLAQCDVCHFPHSKEKKIGPGLRRIYPGGKFANGKKVDDASMRVWIEVGGKDMPGYKDVLKATEIRDLIAYLRTL